MKASEFNTSDYLNSKSAVEHTGKDLKIFEVNAEIIRDQRKMVIGFEGIEKGLVVNKTNREVLAETYGDDCDAWIGQTVRLEIVKVMFEGKRTDSIQVVPMTHDKHTGETVEAGKPSPVIDGSTGKPLGKKPRK